MNQKNSISLYHGNSDLLLPNTPSCSWDSIVTDPPYGLKFMNKKWDYSIPSVHTWKMALRALKPGSHMTVFSSTRTYHRMTCNIEEAGFEIRDTISWIYGSGFPKSLDVAKAMDKQAGIKITPTWKPVTDEAKQYLGFGTALKPAVEFITLARKPLSEKTLLENIRKWGTGYLNIEACKIPSEGESRFPANLIHDGSEEIEGIFPHTKTGSLTGQPRCDNKIYNTAGKTKGIPRYSKGSEGSASRYFYCAKASKIDRNHGLEDMALQSASVCTGGRKEGSAGLNCPRAGAGRTSGSINIHPTVKPTALMEYLCKLITPPGGHIGDFYMGSGSTGRGAALNGFSFTGVDIGKEYCDIAKKRIEICHGGEIPLLNMHSFNGVPFLTQDTDELTELKNTIYKR